MSNSNTHLPVEQLEEIKSKAAIISGYKKDEDSTPQRSGYYFGYIAGATEYATITEQRIEKALHDERNKFQAKLTETETEWARKVIDLHAKGERLALALRRLSGTIQVHPEYVSGQNQEFIDRVAFAEEALKEWREGGPSQEGKEEVARKELTVSYTKGEWYLQEYTDAYTNIVRCNNGKGHETIFIASTPQSSLPEARANAKLMAAAPDLLDALQGIIVITDRNHVAWDKAKAAIKKANLNNPH